MDEFRVLFRRYALGVWRKRWLAMAVSWLVCMAGWAFVSTIPDQYEASARLYVDSDAVLTPLLHGLALDDTPASELDVLQRTLLSRPNLEKLISKTDLELGITGPAGLETLVGRLGTDIRIVPQTRNLFTITYRNASPRLAYDVVQAVLAIFIESKVGTNRTDMENARVFLQQQIAWYERQLREAEARLAEFRTKYVDLLPSEANGGASRLETARGQITDLQDEIDDLTHKRAALQRELAATPAQLDADAVSMAAGASGGNSEIQKAEAALAELRLRDTEQHPDVVNARNYLANLRANPPSLPAAADGMSQTPRSRAGSVPNLAYQTLKTQLFDTEMPLASRQRQTGRRHPRPWPAGGDRPQRARAAGRVRQPQPRLRRGAQELHRAAEPARVDAHRRRRRHRRRQGQDADRRSAAGAAASGGAEAEPAAFRRAAGRFRRRGRTGHPAAAVRPILSLHRRFARIRAAGGGRHLPAGRRRADAAPADLGGRLRPGAAAALRRLWRPALSPAHAANAGRGMMSDRTGHLVERAAALLRSGAGLAPATGDDLALAAGAADCMPPPPESPPLGPPGLDMETLKQAGLALAGPARTRILEEYRIAVGRILHILRSARSHPETGKSGAGKSEAGKSEAGKSQAGESEPGNPAPGNLVMVTSAKPGEGKTFTALNLAASIARNGLGEVLLVDMDVRPTSLSARLGLTDRPGLYDLVATRALCIEDMRVGTAIGGLSCLPAGSRGATITEPGGGRPVSAALERLRRRFADHVIILDCAPCLSSSDPSTLAALADQIIMVVEAERTQRSELEASLELICTCPNITLLLNKVRLTTNHTFGAYHYYGARP